MTYNVFGGTLNLAQSQSHRHVKLSWHITEMCHFFMLYDDNAH